MFWPLIHASVAVGDWIEECNRDRPRSPLGYLPRRAYAASGAHQSDSHDTWIDLQCLVSNRTPIAHKLALPEMECT